MAPIISAIICTHNRGDYLGKSLSSVISQTLPEENYEIIVVDNGSTDNTKQVIRAFHGSRNLRYVYEPIVGLSQARNAGWKSASGKYVAYLDDDAVANPNWLQRIIDKFVGVSPPPMSVGGRIMPIWEADRPEWLLKEMETYIGIIDWSDTPMFLTDDSLYLSGCNLAYRRTILEKSKGFNVRLGRKGHNLLSNEEILMQRYLRRHSLPILYDPEICVQHYVKTQCLSKNWFYRRYYWQGVSDAILEYQISILDEKRWSFLPRVLRDAYSLLKDSQKCMRSWICNKNDLVINTCWACHWIGRLHSNTQIATGRLS